MKTTGRGGRGRVHRRGDPGTGVSFEDRLKEFSERLGAITQFEHRSNDLVEPPASDHEEWPSTVPEIEVVTPLALDEPDTVEPEARSQSSAPRIAPAALEAYVRRLALGLSRSMRRVSSRSDDEAIHDLRVNARRLVAVLRVWSELFRRGYRRRMLKSLRGLRRRLGEAREIEVYTELLESHLAHVSAGRDVLELALHQARRRLEPARRRASQWVREFEPRELVASLDRATRRMPERIAVHPDALEAARARVDRQEAAAFDSMRAAVDHSDNTTLHEARIALKKWRYAREALNAGLALSHDPALEPIRDMQEALGVVQDRASIRRELVPEGAFTEAPEALAPFLEDMEADRREAVSRFLSIATRLDRTR